MTNARSLSAEPDARRALRKTVKLTARLRDRGAKKFEIDVVDLSVSGFRAETEFKLHQGDLVWLTLPGLAGLEARVAWVDGLRLGCSFSQPLYPAVFDNIVRLSEA